MLETNADDSFSVQPFAGYSDRLQGATNATPSTHLSSTPPTNLVTSATSPPPPPSSQDKPPMMSMSAAGGSANPYRIGTGFGTRKPAYGTSGIASFGGSTSVAPPTSQSLTQQPPMMVPSQPIQPPPPATATQQEAGLVPQAPPTSGPSLYQSPPQFAAGPPMGVPPHTSAAAVPIVDPQQWSGGALDQSSGPVRHHWFYLRSGETYWIPFSLVDSHRLEEGLIQQQNTSEEVWLKRRGDVCCVVRKWPRPWSLPSP